MWNNDEILLDLFANSAIISWSLWVKLCVVLSDAVLCGYFTVIVLYYNIAVILTN